MGPNFVVSLECFTQKNIYLYITVQANGPFKNRTDMSGFQMVVWLSLHFRTQSGHWNARLYLLNLYFS
jgi:hypothetical protein